MVAADASERRLISKKGAHESWARTPDPTARTAPGRIQFLGRFEREVDPTGVLSERERARRAEHARKAYFAGLALKSAQARRARSRARELTAEAEAAERELAEFGGEAIPA